jgi:hypothetical protein
MLGKTRKVALLIMAAGIAGVVGTLLLAPTNTITLRSLTPAAQQGFYLRFLKPKPLDIPTFSKDKAVQLAQAADREGGPVEEVVLARAHRVDWGPYNDPLCWVVVMTFGQSVPAGPPFVLVLVDAHSGKVLWQGGEFAGP